MLNAVNAAVPYHPPSVHGHSPIRTLLRKDPAVRALIASWRRLTGGRPVRDDQRRTLIACSAGADSSALTLALAAASKHLVVAHVVHDLREASVAQADAAAAAELAKKAGLPFVSASIRAAALKGNAEANARTLRYRTLASLAAAHECPYIATAHHADDQLETLLMRLSRGASLAGLASIRERRDCHGATLVRPALGITRRDGERICELADWSWVTDQTNADLSRSRASVRALVTPMIERCRPGAALRAAAAATTLASAAEVVADLAREVLLESRRVGDSVVLDLRRLRAVRRVVLSETLMHLHDQLASGGRSVRRLRVAELERAVEAVLTEAPSRRTLMLGSVRLTLSTKELAAVRA